MPVKYGPLKADAALHLLRQPLRNIADAAFPVHLLHHLCQSVQIAELTEIVINY